MIKNARQYRITHAQAEKFRKAIAAAEAGEKPRDENGRILRKAEIDGLRSQLDTLDQELNTYENLQRAKGKRSLSEPIEALGAILVQARAARGWSQKELGDRIGVAMQQIQRYEATFYEKASFERILETCQALGITGRVTAKLAPLPDVGELNRETARVRAQKG